MMRAPASQPGGCGECPFADGIDYIATYRARRRGRSVELKVRRLEVWCLHPDAFPDDPRPMARKVPAVCLPGAPIWCPIRGCVDMIGGPLKR